MACLITTLDEMLNLALGTFTCDHINISILHSFLKIVIQKLKIQTDFVEISGPEVNDLRQMLRRARNPQIEINIEDGDKCYTNLQEQINRLTGVVNKIEADLKAHLEFGERCKKPPAISHVKFKKQKKLCVPEEESFSSDCEDLCTPCDAHNVIAFELLQNQAFLKKLMRHVTSPIIDRIFEFERMIEMLNEKFQNFLNTAEDEYRKTPLIEECQAQVDTIKKEFDKHQTEFIATMEEVQEMLDTKLDKLHIPPLKKYISDRMDKIERQLAAMVQKEQCPKAAGVIMNNLQCLCCTTRVCQKDRVYPVPLLADVHIEAKKVAPRPQIHLCIPSDRARACGGDHTVIRPGEKMLQKLNLIDEFGDKPHLGTDNVEYFKGLDGGMYRLAPE